MKKPKETTRAKSVSLPMPKLGGGMDSSVMCTHDPTCTNSDECIRKSMMDAMGGAHRVSTYKPNGAPSASVQVAPETVTIGEAMRRAVEELGDVVINDELAPSQLRQLAEAYEQVTREQSAFNIKSEDAKTAKKSLEGATEFLLSLVRDATHPKPLPLFDGPQRETDQATMLDAAGDGEQAIA